MDEDSLPDELQRLHERQRLRNGYALVSGVSMHLQNPTSFQIPPEVIKRHVSVDHYVELRIDSSRFSMHEQDAVQCRCPSCNGEMKKPVLRHVHPASLVDIPPQQVPSRGWGEDFWVRVVTRAGDWFHGEISNRLVESRLHGLTLGDPLYFNSDHILAVHDVHRADLVQRMNVAELKELANWLASQHE